MSSGPTQRPFSSRRRGAGGARAASPGRAAAAARRLPLRGAGDDVSLADLKAFLMHPVRDVPAWPARRLRPLAAETS